MNQGSVLQAEFPFQLCVCVSSQLLPNETLSAPLWPRVHSLGGLNATPVLSLLLNFDIQSFFFKVQMFCLSIMFHIGLLAEWSHYL